MKKKVTYLDIVSTPFFLFWTPYSKGNGDDCYFSLGCFRVLNVLLVLSLTTLHLKHFDLKKMLVTCNGRIE